MTEFFRSSKTFVFVLSFTIATAVILSSPICGRAVSAGPSVKFIDAPNLARVSGQVSVAIRAADTSGISRVDLFCDSVQVGTIPVSPALQDTVVYFSWDTTSLANGKHILKANAVNPAGAVASIARPVRVHNYSITPPTGNVIALNPYVKYQTMGGWEATDQAAQLYSPAWNNYKNALFDMAVNDLGINRIRLEIKSGSENPTDYFAQWQAGQITEGQYNAHRYEIINDDSDPNHINPSGFKFSFLDNTINSVILPIRQRLAARGERLWVNVNYVDFDPSAFEHKNLPNEYAEFVLATYLHMQSTFGFVPDSWEVVLEPDASEWSASQVAAAIKAAGDRLAANGFTPRFTAPSVLNAESAPGYIDQIANTPGAMPYVSEFSYHRYSGATPPVLQQIADRAVRYGKKAGMLERIGADYTNLHQDLKTGINSSWQQFTLAGPTSWGPDDGDRYFIVNDTVPSNPVIMMGSRTKLLRQYFKFIRAGARRIQALTGNQTFDPVAFINANGKYVVVVNAGTGGTFSVQGLPPGTYGVKYTTASQYNVDLADIQLNGGQILTTNIPATGVITIFAR